MAPYMSDLSKNQYNEVFVETSTLTLKPPPQKYKTSTVEHEFFICGSVHRESNLITVHQDVTYLVYYISVGSSTCFGC